MRKKRFILVINPCYEYTKVGIFNENEKQILCQSLDFKHNDIKKFYDQKDFRVKDIMLFLRQVGLSLGEVKAIAGRGGLLRPMPGGIYKITPKMVEDLRIGYAGEHVNNLGGILAYELGKKANIPSYIVDSMTIDEMLDIAKFSGLPGIKRRALSHALNIKYVANKVALKDSLNILNTSYIVAYMGRDISVVALKNGKIIDTNNFYDESSFSMQRCGSIAPLKLIDLAFNYKGDYKSFNLELFTKSGLMSYMNTNSIEEVQKIVIEEEEEKYSYILEAMSYNIAKNIGAISAALNFKADKIILTGSLSANSKITSFIEKKINFIAPVEIYKGSYEMESLAHGVVKILKGEEQYKIYENEVEL